MDNNSQATARDRIMVPLDGSPAAEAVLPQAPALTLVQRAECDPGVTMIAMTTHRSSGQGRWPPAIFAITDDPFIVYTPPTYS